MPLRARPLFSGNLPEVALAHKMTSVLARGLTLVLVPTLVFVNCAAAAPKTAAPTSTSSAASPAHTGGERAPHAAAQKESPKVDGYVLKQDGKTVGPQLITITARGIRCESQRSRTILLCCAPDWNVLVYNSQTKRSKNTPLMQFRGYLQRQLVMFSNTSYFDKPVTLAGKTTLFGLPGLLYKEPRGYRNFLMSRAHEGGEPAEMKFETLALPDIPREVGTVLDRYYSVPERPGIPLNFSWIALCQDKRSFLITEKVTKQKVEEALFKTPSDLTVCKTMEEVVLDAASEGSDQLINMFERKGK